MRHNWDSWSPHDRSVSAPSIYKEQQIFRRVGQGIGPHERITDPDERAVIRKAIKIARQIAASPRGERVLNLALFEPPCFPLATEPRPRPRDLTSPSAQIHRATLSRQRDWLRGLIGAYAYDFETSPTEIYIRRDVSDVLR